MRVPLIALFAAVLAPAGAMAQAAGATADGAAGSPGAAAIEDQLSLGEDASLPRVGEAYTAEVIGDWELRCVKTEGEDPCQMHQMLRDGDGAPVAGISIFRLAGGGRAAAGATIIVPLETLLPEQLTIKVDGAPARRYPFAFCDPVGCHSRVGLVAEEIAQFRRGAIARLTIVPAAAPGRKVELDMSLTGFTASFEKTSVVR